VAASRAAAPHRGAAEPWLRVLARLRGIARLRRMSIGVKLTLRYTAAVSITVTAAATLVYAQVAQRVNREARLLLDAQAQELADAFASDVAQSSFDEAVALARPRIERTVRSTDPELALVAELVSRRGEVLASAGPRRDEAPPVSSAVLEGGTRKLLRAVNVGEDRAFLALEQAVPGGAIRLMMDTQRYANNVRYIRDVFALSLPPVLLVTALVGWLLARSSLRPISRITETARRITGESPSEQVPRTGSQDELDRLAETLNDMLGRLSRSMDRMRRFNANVAHQLRTPLTALSSQLEVTLEQPRDDEEYRRVLLDVLDRVRYLALGVEAMLRLAEVEAGLTPDAQQRVRLAEVIETVCEFFEPVALEKGVSLVAEPMPDAWVIGRAAWLHELFSNLVANALEYTPAGGRVALRARLSGDGNVVVDVSDTGPGIAPAQAERVFERFERAGSRAFGFGLGLPIAREIAHAHRGWIAVAPRGEPDAMGATLSTCLPLARGGAPA
jgi:signal transduction histidine kinase